MDLRGVDLERLALELEACRETIAERTVDLCRLEAGWLEGLGSEERLEAVRDGTREGIGELVGVLRECGGGVPGQVLSEGARRRYEALGRVRAEEGVPLGLMLTPPRLAAKATREYLSARVDGETLEAVAPLAEEFTSGILAALAKGYEAVAVGSVEAGSGVLAEHLKGSSESSFGSLLAAGLAESTSYRVVVVPVHSSSGSVQRHLDEGELPDGWLWTLVDERLVVLGPSDEIFRSLSFARPYWLGEGWGPVALSEPCGSGGIAEAYVEAREASEVALRLSLPGPVWAERAVLERTILRAPSSFRSLLPVLDPVVASPDGDELLSVVRAYLAVNFSRELARHRVGLTTSAFRTRLERVEALLGGRIKDRRANLEVALLVYDLIGP